MRSRSFALAASVLLAAATPGTITLTTTSGMTSYLSACAAYPPIDPGLSISSTHPLSGATVSYDTSATTPTGHDILEIDPDPTVECSWNGDCGPCPPLHVAYVDDRRSVSISGVASASVYEACLRRVHWRSTAYGGDEGIGTRSVRFSVIDAGDPVSTSSALKSIQVTPADGEACSAALASRSISLTWDGGDFHYGMACKATCDPYITLLGEGITVTTPDPSVPGVQFAEAHLELFSRMDPPPVFDEANDLLWILRDPSNPASTYSQPCPGLTVRTVFDASSRRVGVNVTGWSTSAAYTDCLNRLYYTNLADTAAETLLGPRHVAVTVHSTHLAYSYTFMGTTRLLYVEEPCTGGCTSTPGAEPSTPSPSATPVAVVSASPSPSPLVTSSVESIIPSAFAAMLAISSAVLLGHF